MISNFKQDLFSLSPKISYTIHGLYCDVSKVIIFLQPKYCISGKISGDVMTEFARARPAIGAKL